MKFLVKFSLFEEASYKQMKSISSDYDDYFTVAFEFEIETLDDSNKTLEFDQFDDTMLDDIYSDVTRELSIRRNVEKNIVKELLYDFLDQIESDNANENIIDEIFNPDNFTSDREKKIVEFLKSVVIKSVLIEDYSYLKEMCYKWLPNFISKWEDKIDFVGDATLDRGIEIKPKTYLNSLSEAKEMINDFYSDMESQDYWKFTEKTGLHINIGTHKASEWNPVKGILILNDYTKDERTPFVFKDMTWRMNSKYCGSIISSLNDRDKEKIKNIDISDINLAEKKLNNIFTSIMKHFGLKSFGLNISRIKDNYVEFRYVGGDISKETLIDKLEYFAFIVYCMTNKDFKRKEYLKKLYKFINNL